MGIQAPAIRDVSFFKVQVSAFFRNDPGRLSEILNALGYARFMNTFNAIYAEIMDICSVASAYYKGDSVRKQQFTFSKVLSSQGSSRKASATEPATVVQ